MKEEKRVRSVRRVTEGAWEYVGYIITLDDGRFEWLLVRFPAREQGLVSGEDKDWGIKPTEKEAEAAAIEALEKAIKRDQSRKDRGRG